METPPWTITCKCIFLALMMQKIKEHNAYLVTFLCKNHFHFCSLKLCSLENSHKNRNFAMSLVLHKYLPLTSRFSPELASEHPFSLVTLDKTSSAAASNYQLGVGQRGTTQDKLVTISPPINISVRCPHRWMSVWPTHSKQNNTKGSYKKTCMFFLQYWLTEYWWVGYDPFSILSTVATTYCRCEIKCDVSATTHQPGPLPAPSMETELRKWLGLQETLLGRAPACCCCCWPTFISLFVQFSESGKFEK